MDSARKLLSAAYEELGFAQGSLLEATGTAREASAADWIAKGDWLALANSIGAERVFFVEENPVVIFAELKDQDGAWAKAFNESWCMARPQLLFLASPGELAVYDLTREPTRRHDSEARSQRLLAVAESASDVQAMLHQFRRSQIESGKLYEEHRFAFDTRADRALIRDLKENHGFSKCFRKRFANWRGATTSQKKRTRSTVSYLGTPGARITGWLKLVAALSRRFVTKPAISRWNRTNIVRLASPRFLISSVAS